MVKEIRLTRGKVALVDDEDYEWLNQWKWYYAKTHYGTGVAARRYQGRGTTTFMHRVVLDAPGELQVDHINMNRLDNRRGNLRLCTNAENNRNRGKRRGTTSRFKGVNQRPKEQKWRASITIDGKVIALGYFDTEVGAALAYNEAAKEHFGKFARLNDMQ